ncbi:Uncharacterized protein family UPF0197 [Cynara cardunculus var. scolymus]|uniref:Dolichyl-diphosphooligosaccharide-protein glycosyltransferase subunit OST5 n=1 Tax=Cynara cardunculus var. scolymus TaxID=59895 RepID=A0A118K0Q4_CYNCS|nr:Uncharacterized protein family UPF0197 [Cynara cardunculus var. scolymus]
MVHSVKPISSPVPDAWYPTLAVLMLAVGLVITASFFMALDPCSCSLLRVSMFDLTMDFCIGIWKFKSVY